MNIEQSIKPVSPVFLRSYANQFNQSKETFHDIFQRRLNHKSGSRPPKIELTGTLIPTQKLAHCNQCGFKLETDQNEYFLSMSGAMTEIAKKLEPPVSG